MKIRKEGIALIFFIIFVVSRAQWQVIPTILLIAEAVKWSIEFVGYIKSAHQTISSLDGSDSCSDDEHYFNIVTGKVVHAMSEISDHLEDMSREMNARTSNLRRMVKELKLANDINMRIEHLVSTMGVIDGIYSDLLMRTPTSKTAKFDGKKLCKFARQQLFNDLLTVKINEMHNIIVPSRQLQTPLLSEILDDFQMQKDALCGTGHSTLEYFHSIYNSLMMVEIKGFVMTAFFHHLLFNYNGTSADCKYSDEKPDFEIDLAQRKFREHLEEYTNSFLQKMQYASAEFRACDQGDEFVKDETYYELEGAIQTIVHLPSDYLYAMKNEDLVESAQCKNFDGSYGTPAVWCNPEHKFCTTSAARNCLGYTFDCKDPTEFIYGCLAENSSRRYEWIKWKKDDHVDTALAKCSGVLKIDPETRYWYNQKPCHCICNDNDVDSESTHIFNLQWIESEVSKNMIIIGARFIVQHRVMQFQIKQGTLGSNFRVDEGDWIPVKDISEEIRAVRLKKKLRGEFPNLVENVDYLILKKRTNNAILLDTLHVPFSHVLTGVRFYFPPEQPRGIGKIQIAIKSTKFNHITGKLDLDSQQIITSNQQHVELYSYPKENVNNPRVSTTQVAGDGHFVYIDASDLEHDSGQTTLPYFDAIPVVSSPPSPQGGIGIFHKGAGDFTGFVSLKFVSLKYLKYMKQSLHEIDDEKKFLEIPVDVSHSSKDQRLSEYL